MKTTSQVCFFCGVFWVVFFSQKNSGLQHPFLFACCTWLVPRTPARLLSKLYVGQPWQEKPCLFHHKHGDAQSSRIHPNRSSSCPSSNNCCLLWQQWSFCRYIRSWSRQEKCFQADWLPNQAHHIENPAPGPTQNRAQNYTEPTWVKQTWNHTCRKGVFFERQDWIYDYEVTNR